MDHDAPCTVVDAPAVVDGNVIAEEAADFFREFCIAFDRILKLVEFFREAVHIVYLTWFFGALDIRAGANQWAETAKMAFGFSGLFRMSAPMRCISRVRSFSSMASMGLPCPTKITGVFFIEQIPLCLVFRKYKPLSVYHKHTYVNKGAYFIY